jgi:hypothetical protein
LTRSGEDSDKPRAPDGTAEGPFRGRGAVGGGGVSHPEVRIVHAKPCPTELTAPINPDRGIEGHRNLFCNYYDACLDEAVRRGWNSWTCTRCSNHVLEPEVEGGIEAYATQRRLV